MRKLLLLLSIILLLACMVSLVLASGHREAALAYLTEKHGVPEERIGLNEIGITELEFTAQSFWYGNYIIVPEGETASGFSGKGETGTLPSSEIMPLPAYDRQTDGREPVMQALPRDMVDEGYVCGDIYICVDTGEILEPDGMENYYRAEWQLAEQEWERLRKEAGKLDVLLYLKLQELSRREKVTVWIEPAPVETDQVRTGFTALKKKYPEHTLGMELPEALLYGYGYTVPDMRDLGVSSGEASASYRVPGGDEPVRNAAIEPAEPVVPLKKQGTGSMANIPDQEYWKEYGTFWEELEQIRMQAVIPSLESIEETLDSMGITYKENGASVAADVTVDQIHEIAQLPSVWVIFEEAAFTAMDVDAGGELMARNSAPGKTNTFPYLPLIAGIAVLLIAIVVYRRHSIHNRRV